MMTANSATRNGWILRQTADKNKGEMRMKDRCAFCGEYIPAGQRHCKECGQVGVNTLKATRMSQDSSKEENIDRKLMDYWMSQISNAERNEPISGEKWEAKADSGKPMLSLVPKQIIYEIEKVRSFGVKKYKDPENWKKVEMERYHEALLRHTLAVWEDINAKDKESGLLHLSHIATNVAFLLEMMNDKE